jgi:hypothetical protein
VKPKIDKDFEEILKYWSSMSFGRAKAVVNWYVPCKGRQPNNSPDCVKTYEGVGYAIGGGFNL